MAQKPEYEEYHVQWEIEVGGAKNHIHAAELALEAIKDKDTTFKSFTVKKYVTGEEIFVDLNED